MCVQVLRGGGPGRSLGRKERGQEGGIDNFVVITNQLTSERTSSQGMEENVLVGMNRDDSGYSGDMTRRFDKKNLLNNQK